MRILMLDLDTLRPDHLGCYGYHRNTSPNIDAVARQGVRFNQYYCPDAPCLPSRAALVTGAFGIHSGVVGHGGTAADLRLVGRERSFRDALGGGQSLWVMLAQAGLKTVSISPFAERHSAWWFNAGFREMHNTGQGGMESAEHVTPTALRWVEQNAQQDNWFLHINYWDPHTPYRAPAEFGNPFANEPLPAWITEEVLAEHLKHVGPHSAHEINMFNAKEDPKFPRHPGALRNMADVRRMMDGYDCGIRYMDGHIGQLFEGLKKAGVWDDLAIIITADHGENMGELGIYGEHATADVATCRIPMIIRWPGMAAGKVCDGLRANLDLAPTLAELLNRRRHPLWQGESYANALRTGQDTGRDDLVISQCAHVCQRSIRFGPWLYMRTYHDGYHLFPQEMLYNTVDDPHLQRDLAAARPEVVREGAARLLRWHDEMMRTMPHGYTVDPLDTVMAEGGPLHARGRLAGYCEQLQATGRGWAIEELKRRHPGEFTR